MAGVEGSNPFRPITHLYLFIHIILTLRSDREIWFFTGQHDGCSLAKEIPSENLQPIERFLMALRAPESKRQYPRRLESFFHFLRLQGNFEQKTSLFCQLVESHKETDWLTNELLKFLHYQKNRVARKEIEEATVSNYFKAIKLFCEMNNIIAINWKLLARSMPKGRHSSNDRPPSRDEINKLIDYPDRRIKPIILVMISSGIRVGAWDDLKWKHIIPIEKDGTLMAAKLHVYPGENEEYFTFITTQRTPHWLSGWIFVLHMVRK